MHPCSLLVSVGAALICCSLPSVVAAAEAEVKPTEQSLLFCYFVGNGEDGLHLLRSDDGYIWEPIAEGRSLLKPTAGHDKLMRDPSIARGPDGRFHMVWTVSWGEREIGYSSSPDLVHWETQQSLPVMKHEPTARNCWAPDLCYDQKSGEFVILWATTIPGRFPKTDGQDRRDERDLGYDHRIYGTTTKDFRSFTPTKLVYEPGFNVIDATILASDGRYAMLLKNETNRPFPVEKNLRVAWADAATGPYGDASAPITGKYWAEGPTAVRVGDKWSVYFDKYTEHKYGLVTSPDLKTWTDESDKLQMPNGVRHGTAFWAPAEVFEGLRKLK